jgi:multiple sugar transport system substrate-binding protein
MESADTQKVLIDKASLAPVRSDSYTDSSLTSKYPYLKVLKTSLDSAVARPITPYYQGVTGAIQNNVFQALQSASNGGSPDVKKVLDSTAQAITAASAG